MCEGKGIEWKVKKVGDEVAVGVWEGKWDSVEGENGGREVEEELLVAG